MSRTLVIFLVSARCAVALEPDFERAMSLREFKFPRDHGNHPGFKTEWWYFTGLLETSAGERIGFQATWFRSSLVSRSPTRPSPLGARDVFFFHGALTDVGRGSFQYEHKASRGAINWATAGSTPPAVNVLQHRLRLEDDGVWRLRFSVRGHDLDLRLQATRAPLLHGKEPGLSIKGPLEGQASYYVSSTRLQVSGELAKDGESGVTGVTGQAWFDHEFGSGQLAAGQVGWDWFSVALDDGTDLMLYQIRHEDGTPAVTSSGTLRMERSQRQHLQVSDFSLRVLERWRSPQSGGKYPSRWSIEVPDHDLRLEVRPVLSAQELRTHGSTGITYWEGLCRFVGTHRGKAVEGYGYVELVGYAGGFLADI